MTEPKAPYKIDGRPSTIFRVVKSKDNPYVMIDKRPIDNPELSFKAKGILTYLMSRPDGWEVNITDLMKHGKEGAAAIRTGLRELRDAHHVCYHAARDVGRITGWLIEVYEIPYDLPLKNEENATETDVLPDDDFLHVENLQIENRGQVLKTLSNNEIKREREEKKEKPLSLDFSTMTVMEAQKLPTLRLYKKAADFFPGSLVWEFVHNEITKHALTYEKIHEAAVAWDLRGFKRENVKGVLEWSINGVPKDTKGQAVQQSAPVGPAYKPFVAVEQSGAIPMPDSVREQIRNLKSKLAVGGSNV